MLDGWLRDTARESGLPWERSISSGARRSSRSRSSFAISRRSWRCQCGTSSQEPSCSRSRCHEATAREIGHRPVPRA